jgi:hypothetical protein
MTDAQEIARDPAWSWSVDSGGQTWRLAWTHPEEARRHQLRASNPPLARRVFPFAQTSSTPEGVELKAEDARPLSHLIEDGLSPVQHHRVLEELGRWLRALHDLPAPEGFGDPEGQPRLQTINAFLAARFVALSQRLSEREELHLDALPLLADLRNELSSFHPHGRSTWTIGRLTTDRLAIRPGTRTIAGVMDLGLLSLRPPEVDLAALQISGVLPKRPLAARAFWRGYSAALTRDLARRIDYFARLFSLELQLECAGHLPTSLSGVP